MKLYKILFENADTQDVNSIVQNFLSSDEGKKNAKKDCKTVTRAFTRWAKNNKIEAEALSLLPPSKEFIEKHPEYKGKSGTGDGHIMPVVNGNAIDFTVRQFGGEYAGRPYDQPLITPMNNIKAVYGKFGYFTDAPDWADGQSSVLANFENLPKWFKQDFADEDL